MSDASLWVRSLAAVATVGATLFALQYLLRRIQAGAASLSARGRLLQHVETLPLPNATALHVVRIAGRTFALGGGQGHLHLICELSATAPHAAEHQCNEAAAQR